MPTTPNYNISLSFFYKYHAKFDFFGKFYGSLLTFRKLYVILTSIIEFRKGILRNYFGHMYQPDITDWKIIALLNEDGRMSSAEVARRLGDVSARTVKNRIDILTKRGIINIRSIINPDLVGYCILADVFIQVDPGWVRKVATTLAEFSQVSYVACATGDTDIIISIRAQQIQELYDFVTEVVGKISSVRHTKTYLLPLNLKTNVTWLPPNVFDNETNQKT